MFLLMQNVILRVDGRIANATRYQYDLVYPIVITKHHLRCKHLGIGTTMTKLRRSRYWVPQARQSVKSVISDVLHV